ncbi:MAG: CBS domain-containing protein [Bacteroidales bacterium]|jgi:CBS domain-containing protein|nr:CBS domain-containing protein [Bacteroidales bacterium]
MTSQITFYLSQILGKNFVSDDGIVLGKITDFLIDQSPLPGQESEPVRPRLVAVKVKKANQTIILDFSSFEIKKFKRKLRIVCLEMHSVSDESYSNCLWLAKNILDKQIVDINGRKLVRVNDVRLVMIPSGTYVIAVDVGLEGLLRRIGIEKPIQAILDTIHFSIPGKFILWDDIEAVDFANASIKLSKSSSKLNTLHPSDLADIIEDLDKASRTVVFASLDEETAADVLEELEPHAQIHIVESLPIEKVADVLEKMPADEVADLLDALNDDKAEELLEEMEKESSEEVRELLEYPDKYVGSLMTTDFLTFNERLSVAEILEEIRKLKPDPEQISTILVTDKNDHFLSSISLGEIVIAEPTKLLKEIMNKNPVTVFDDDKVDTLAELISKYHLPAIPVINKEKHVEGVVVMEDIVDDLLSRRKTK